jgi:head-tail adaptor
MSAFQSAIHTVCHADGWANVCDVWPRARDPHSTKPEAQAAGRERAKQEQTEHIVHDEDGTVEQRISYRNRTDSSTGERDE